MPSNRRRHANALPLLSLAMWIVIAGFLCASGLGYVYCKNQLHSSGTEINKLEKELAYLQTECVVAQSKIATLSSRAELQRKLNSGFIKLIPVTDDRIVRVAPASSAAVGEIRAVSNERNAP